MGWVWHPGKLTQHDLFGKYTSDPTETGLGLTDTEGSTDYEIRKDQYVQFDMTDAILHYGTHFSLEVGSLQAGEGYSLFGSTTGSSTSHSPALTLLSAGGLGMETYTVNLDLTNYKFIEVSAYGTLAAGDTLVLNVVHHSPNPTPEPFTMGLGIAGVGLAVRRRMKATA